MVLGREPKIGQCPHCGGAFHAGHKCSGMKRHSMKVVDVRKAISERIRHNLKDAKTIEEWEDALIDSFVDEIMDIRVKMKLI